MSSSQSFLDQINLQWKTSIALVGGSKWGSNFSDYRSLIREDLAGRLKSLGESEHSSWRDLNVVPVAENWQVSISHCRDFGGYAYGRGLSGIGFDVETAARLTRANLLRVSEEAELNLAPNPAMLWCAKEAVYKFFPREQQPSNMGKVIVKKWWPAPEVDAFEFSAVATTHPGTDISGFSWEIQGLCFSLVIERPSMGK